MTLGNGHNLKTVGHRTMVLDIEPSPGKFKKYKVSDVLYAPDSIFNLVNVARATDKIDRTVITVKGCEFLAADGKPVVTGRKVGKLLSKLQEETAVGSGDVEV